MGYNIAIDGQCIRYDYSGFEKEIRKCNYLISNASKSLNQIAMRVNEKYNEYLNNKEVKL